MNPSLRFQRSGVCALFVLVAAFLFTASPAFAVKNPGSLTGVVADTATGTPVPGATVYLPKIGRGAVADADGRYQFDDLARGYYTVEFSSIGYKKLRYQVVLITAGETATLDIKLESTVIPLDDEVIVIGERPLLQVNAPATRREITPSDLRLAPARPLVELIEQIPGVTSFDREVHIRGSRTYETEYLVDGLSVSDPFLRRGMALEISPSAVERVSVITGGIKPETGRQAGGVVEVATRNPGRDLTGSVGWSTDHLLPKGTANWKSDELWFNLAGPLGALWGKPGLGGNERYAPGFVVDWRGEWSDNYYGSPHPGGLHSSTFSGSKWTPRGDNRYRLLTKLAWRLSSRDRIAAVYQSSVTANQDLAQLDTYLRSPVYSHGYPLEYAHILDRYNVFTHRADAQSLDWSHRLSERTSWDLTLGRVFTTLRADVNGKSPDAYERPVDDSPEIVEANEDSTVFTATRGDGFFDRGDGDIWYDHFVETFSAKLDIHHEFERNIKADAGAIGDLQRLQVVDIFQPWVGNNGLNVDAYRVNPFTTAFYGQVNANLNGAIFDVGARYEMWLPGRELEEAVADTSNPVITPEARDRFDSETFFWLGRKAKGHLLPRLGVSLLLSPAIAVTGSVSRLITRPNPRYIYAKILTPSPSSFQLFGNPNLDPERATVYEAGVKYLHGTSGALTVNTYLKDVKDGISAIAVVPDESFPDDFYFGYANRELVTATGLELTYEQRREWYGGSVFFAFSRVKGERSLASDIFRGRESEQGLLLFEDNTLDWDKPWRFAVKANATVDEDRQTRFFGINLPRDWNAFIGLSAEAGKRYTPYERKIDSLTGIPVVDIDGNPVYERGSTNSKLGPMWSSLDLALRKNFKLFGRHLTASLEITNLLNRRNHNLINPLTGEAYSEGDDIVTGGFVFDLPPIGYRLPVWENPTRFGPPRHIKLGMEIAL